MSPFRKKTNKSTTKTKASEPTTEGQPKKKKQTNITETFESNGVELEITVLEINNEAEITGARVRTAAGTEWIYVDPGKLNDLALVLEAAGYPK